MPELGPPSEWWLSSKFRFSRSPVKPDASVAGEGGVLVVEAEFHAAIDKEFQVLSALYREAKTRIGPYGFALDIDRG